MLATELIRAVKQACGHLEPDGDGLVVEAPEPLPESIMTELRARKAEVLAALSGHTAGPSSGNDDLLRRADLAVVPDGQGHDRRNERRRTGRAPAGGMLYRICRVP